MFHNNKIEYNKNNKYHRYGEIIDYNKNNKRNNVKYNFNKQSYNRTFNFNNKINKGNNGSTRPNKTRINQKKKR